MVRLIFVNRYAPPDHSATAQILGDLVRYLASLGHDVHVVTSDQRYNDPAARLPGSEVIDGVTFLRVRGSTFGRGNLLLRAVDYMSFYVRALFALWLLTRRADILIAKTDPPLLSIMVALVAALKQASLVNWLQDIFPEIALRLGVRALAGPIGGAARLARDWSLRTAALNVVISDRMREYVISRGISPSRVSLIFNWNIDDEFLGQISVEDSRFRVDWGLEGKFVVCYSGNLGRAHDYIPILSAARSLSGDRGIIFLFIGGGHGMSVLRQLVEAEGMGGMFKFVGYQGRDDLAHSLAAADVHLVSMMPKLEGLIFPSKFYGIAAAGRPMVAIVSPDGEIARLLQRFECGMHVGPDEGDALAQAIRVYRDDPELRGRQAANARFMWEVEFKRNDRLARWATVLQPLAGLGSSSKRGHDRLTI